MQTLQDVAHDPLKNSGPVLDTHRHNTPLVSLTCQIHGGLSPGLRVKGNLMEPFTQVHNSGNLVFGLIFQHIFNEVEGVRSGQGSLIKLAVVHNEMPFSLLFLPRNETVGRLLGGRARLNPATSQNIFHHLLLCRGTLLHQPYWLHGLRFSVWLLVKFSKPQQLSTTDLRIYLARTETNLPTTNIPLIVREDAFPHEHHLRRDNRFLGRENATDMRSCKQLFGAVSFSVAPNGSGSLTQLLFLNLRNA